MVVEDLKGAEGENIFKKHGFIKRNL